MLKLPSLFRSASPKTETLVLSADTATTDYALHLSGVIADKGVELDLDGAALARIPAQGSLMVLANDPLLGLSTLALMRLIAQVREDFKVIAPDLVEAELAQDQHLISTSSSFEAQYEQALEHLLGGGVLIVQPVHFGKSQGIPKLTQERWPSEFLRLAEYANCRLLHVHVSSDELPLLQQVRLFYRQPGLVRGIAQKLLPQAFDLQLKVGAVVEAEQYKQLQLREKVKTKLLRKQLYRVAEGKASYFQSLPDIALPEPKSLLVDEISKADALGTTKDGKLIYLAELSEDSSLLREIGRLREESFRLVGEGSGKALDVDGFDLVYQHIILWDREAQDLVGAYRLRETHDLSFDQLYTSTLVDYQGASKAMLARGVELGRSFVQPKYWGSRSLEYLWTGIAAYLRRNPRIRYLFGAVSISNAYSKQAKDLLLGYYSRYYFSDAPIVQCKRPYRFSHEAQSLLERVYGDLDSKQAFIVLKEQLSVLGHSVPTLYKQYTELCDDRGALFHGFNIDPDFQDCIDGIVVVDMAKLKPLKRKRYGLLEHDFEAYDSASNNAVQQDAP